MVATIVPGRQLNGCDRNTVTSGWTNCWSLWTGRLAESCNLCTMGVIIIGLVFTAFSE
jgi:hypothetical protein